MYWSFLLFLDHCKTVHCDRFFAKWGRTVLQYGHRITQRLWTDVGLFHGHADGAVARSFCTTEREMPFMTSWLAKVFRRSWKRISGTPAILNKKAVDHPIFGNRNNRLTLIGLPNACRIVAAALKSALCTEAEVSACTRGKAFTDRWPQTQYRVT